MEKANLAALQKTIGYTFTNEALLQTAMTHSSYSHERRNAVADNERLEFLGDAVLQMTISRLLYLRYPTATEGVLSLYRQFLVCEATLARIAARLSLGRYLRLGHGEERQGGREKRSILADAMEAMFGAVFLDAANRANGVMDELLSTLFEEEIALCETLHAGDYKSRLQQLVEQDGTEQLDYRVSTMQGPVHDPIFHVEALLNSNVIGRGSGHSKQEAEQCAAREALLLFGAHNL